VSPRAAAPPRGLLALMMILAILGGCAGSLFKTQVAPPTMYLLSAELPSDAGGTVPGGAERAELAVLRPRVRTGLDTERIAALYPDRRLDYFADARWSGPLDEVLEDLAVQLFHSRAGLVDVSGESSAFASQYWLEIQVADFQAEYARGGAAPPTAHVHFLATIGSSRDRTVIARFEAQALEPASSNRMSAIVDAYNRAANKALLQIAAGCAATLAPSRASIRRQPPLLTPAP